MMADKLSMSEDKFTRIIEEIDSLGGFQDFYSEANRRKHKTGGHRLKHLVPELAPDQPALASLLAELAIQNRGDDFSDTGSIIALQVFPDARGKDHKIQALANKAPHDGISWLACEFFLDSQYRSYIHKNKDNTCEKRIAPIPRPIAELRDQCDLYHPTRCTSPVAPETGERRQTKSLA